MHDISDGYEFAKLVAEELLDRFISTFKTPSLVSKKTLYSNSFKNNTITTPSSATGIIPGSGDKKSNSPQPQNPPNLFGGVNSIDLNDLETSVDTSHRFDQMMNAEQLSVDDLEQDEFDFNNVNVDEKIFEAKLAEIYLELVYPIIEHLDSVRGILNSWVIESGDEGILTTTKPQLEADLKFLVNNCDRLLNGEMQNLSIKGNGKNLHIVIVEHKCHLVVLLESNVQPEITSFAIEKAVFLLRKVYALRKNIKIQ